MSVHSSPYLNALNISGSMATDKHEEPKSQAASAAHFHMHFVEAFIFTVKALTIINCLSGPDTELQHKENWQKKTGRVCAAHYLSFNP